MVALFPRYQIFKVWLSKSRFALDLLNQSVPNKRVSSFDSITCKSIGIAIFWRIIFTSVMDPNAFSLCPLAVTTIVLDSWLIFNPNLFINLAVMILTAAPESSMATTGCPLILTWHLIAIVFLLGSNSTWLASVTGALPLFMVWAKFLRWLGY